MNAEIDTEYGPSYKFLKIVLSLHKKGYEKIRIFPYLDPSGCYWRCEISCKNNFSKINGVEIDKYKDKEVAFYSSASCYDYFGWNNGKNLTPEQLADRFINEFPYIVKKGKGKDENYIKWFTYILEKASMGDLPIAMDDYTNYAEAGYLISIYSSSLKIKLPV